MIAALIGFALGLAFGATAAWIFQAGKDAARFGHHLEALHRDPAPHIELEEVRIVYRGPQVADWVNGGIE